MKTELISLELDNELMLQLAYLSIDEGVSIEHLIVRILSESVIKDLRNNNSNDHLLKGKNKERLTESVEELEKKCLVRPVIVGRSHSSNKDGMSD